MEANKGNSRQLGVFDTIELVTNEGEILILTIFSIQNNIIECVVIEETENYSPEDEYIIKNEDSITILF